MKLIKTQIITACSVVVLLLCTTISIAQNNQKDVEHTREGCLFEIGLSGGIISIEDSEGIQTFDVAKGAIGFPELKLGYMLNDNLAVTAVMPGMIYEFNNNDRHFGGFIPSVQYWVKDKWWIHGGLGLAIDGPALYDINNANDDWNFGCSVMASSGYDIYKKNNFTFNLQSKLILGRAFLEGDAHRDAISFSVGVGINWL